LDRAAEPLHQPEAAGRLALRGLSGHAHVYREAAPADHPHAVRGRRGRVRDHARDPGGRGPADFRRRSGRPHRPQAARGHAPAPRVGPAVAGAVRDLAVGGAPLRLRQLAVDRGAPLECTRAWVDPWANFQMMVWPVLTVGDRFSAVTTRMTRSTVLEVLREDYIRTAWAKGLGQRAIVIRHALKNSMLPVITLIGTEFAFLIGGLVVTETVVPLNGGGRFRVDAVAHRDYPVVQALVFLIAFSFVIVNLLVDLTYAWFDPRIRYR